MSTDAIRAPTGDAPTSELVTAAVTDRCSNCQAPLAPDQRYCVNCGERRGRARFSPETFVTTTPTTTVSDGVPPRRQPRLSSAATLVAGVATLLIALGVGVLIGHDSNSSTPARSAGAQVITVGGGGTATNASSGNTSTTHASTASTGKKSKTTVVHVTQKTVKAATAAAAKVLGSSASSNLSHNVQQKVGGSCTGGAGCQNGRFTGNFFPGG